MVKKCKQYSKLKCYTSAIETGVFSRLTWVYFFTRPVYVIILLLTLARKNEVFVVNKNRDNRK